MKAVVFTLFLLFTKNTFALMGGEPSKGFLSAVAFPDLGCSAVKINSTRFLMAGHCLNMNGYQYFSKSGDVLTLVYRTLQGEKEEIKITVQNIRVHPTYIKKMQTEFPTREAAAQFTSYDLGTIDIEETTPVIPFVSVSRSKIQNNTTVTLTGYGCERYNQEPSYRFKISEKIIQKTENTTFILSALDRNLKTGSAGCEGDSGAPVYSKKNQVILLTGINSMSYGLLDLNDDNTIHYQQNVSTEVTRLDSAPIQKWLSSRN